MALFILAAGIGHMSSSDGKTRDLVSTLSGAGWDSSQSQHPYHMIEPPFGPHYCVYNRRQMACCFDKLDRCAYDLACYDDGGMYAANLPSCHCTIKRPKSCAQNASKYPTGLSDNDIVCIIIVVHFWYNYRINLTTFSI